MKSLQPPHSNYSRRPSGTRSKQHRHYQLSQRRKRQLVVMTKHTDDSASEDDGKINFNSTSFSSYFTVLKILLLEHQLLYTISQSSFRKQTVQSRMCTVYNALLVSKFAYLSNLCHFPNTIMWGGISVACHSISSSGLKHFPFTNTCLGLFMTHEHRPITVLGIVLSTNHLSAFALSVASKLIT